MFDIFLDSVKKILKSRLFPIAIIYIILFIVIINRLFVLQIVQGPEMESINNSMIEKKREIQNTRGNIYDCNGKLLASSALTYSVVIEDSTKIKDNKQRNVIANQLIKIIEGNGDTLDNEFYIKQNKDKKLEFTVSGTALTKFKKNVYTFDLTKKKELKPEQVKATAQQVYDYLRTDPRMFQIKKSYGVKDILKIMSIRYALFFNYPKYTQVTVASNISNKTMAAVEEDSADLPGVEIEQQTHRVYEDSAYFSDIMGYTGLINQNELDEYNKEKEIYGTSDIVGKTGLEKKYESILKGTKGNEIVSVNSVGKVIKVLKRTNPTAGNDIYLTINKDLQIEAYKLLEKELATILLDNMSPNMDYGSKGKNATKIKVPIYEVYFALINNNIIDINHFNNHNASSLEKQTYKKYKSMLNDVFNQLDTYLSFNNNMPNSKAGDMEDYLDYFYTALKSNGILISNSIPSDNQTYMDYVNGKISLSSFLKKALANNWIDLSQLNIGNKYYSVEELYNKLISTMKDKLKDDNKFNKMVYKNLVFSYKLSGREICLLLFDQGVLEYKNKDKDINGLRSGIISPYTFIRNRIKTLDITPGMLALTPCRGSIVITDTKTGDVRALVSYPGYDNNKFSGKIDPAYWNKVNNDLTNPMLNKATYERTAPGSTFKMVTSVASLEKGITDSSRTVADLGEFKKIGKPYPKCDAYPSSHGTINIMDAISVSCNYYFFEMGYELSINKLGKYDSNLGLSKLKRYATMFGLNKRSGIELNELNPNLSTTDAVRSAIGQGSNVYTPVQLSRYVTTLANRGTCYDLTLLDKVVDNKGNLIKNNKAKVDHKLKNIKSSTWDIVQKGMYNVVNKSNGTVNTIFRGLGVTVAGKTGTSQISKSQPNNSLFVSYAPYDDPEISVTTVIPNGYTSHNAAELAKKVYAYYFKLKDEKDLMKDDSKSNKTTALD